MKGGKKTSRRRVEKSGWQKVNTAVFEPTAFEAKPSNLRNYSSK